MQQKSNMWKRCTWVRRIMTWGPVALVISCAVQGCFELSPIQFLQRPGVRQHHGPQQQQNQVDPQTHPGPHLSILQSAEAMPFLPLHLTGNGTFPAYYGHQTQPCSQPYQLHCLQPWLLLPPPLQQRQDAIVAHQPLNKKEPYGSHFKQNRFQVICDLSLSLSLSF